jgi:hypothetical protein
MVHALMRTKQFLKSGGTVVIVHDTPFAPYIEIGQGTSRSPAGWLYDNERFPLIRAADQAVDAVIDAGLMKATSQRVFLYQKQIQSYEGFREWLEKKWETSFLPIHTDQLVRARFLAGESDTYVYIHRQARIRSLRSI